MGAPGSHKSSVHYEQGGGHLNICRADRPLRVKLLSLSPWALWPLSHWIIYISTVEPSEPSVTQIHRQEFPLARNENRQSVLFNAWSKGVVGRIPSSRQENLTATLTIKILGESRRLSVRCSYVGVFMEHTPHVRLLRNDARGWCRCSPTDLCICVIWCLTWKIDNGMNAQTLFLRPRLA